MYGITESFLWLIKYTVYVHIVLKYYVENLFLGPGIIAYTFKIYS